jgi:hypothetical protein
MRNVIRESREHGKRSHIIGATLRVYLTEVYPLMVLQNS